MVEQPAVIEAVRTLAAPGPEVQDADELPLGHERDDHLHRRRPHRVQSRRVEVELAEPDGARVLLEVQEQRIVLGHVEGH